MTVVFGRAKAGLMVSAAVVALTFPIGAGAFAQTGQPAPPANGNTGPVTSSEAAPPAGDTGALTDIVVTARRTEERLQNVPISITVQTTADLQNRSVFRVADLAQQTPSLNIIPATISPTSVNISMRGQALADIRLNWDQAISVYQDGVYVPRAQGLNASDLADIARVEVLSGPQGTLYGKNSTGGAVVIYTNTARLGVSEGLLSARYGSFGESNVTGMYNLPIGSDLAVRVVAEHSGSNGYGDDLYTQVRTGESSTFYGRGSLLWQPSSTFSVTLRGDYTSARVAGGAYQGFETLRPLADGVTAFARQAALQLNPGSTLATLTPAQIAAADAALRSYYSVRTDDQFGTIPSIDRINVYGASGEINWSLTNDLRLKSITALRGFRRHSSNDTDGTPFDLLGYALQRVRDHQFSQEVQLSGHLIDRVSFVTGGFFGDERGNEAINLTSLPLVAGTRATYNNAHVVNRSLGVFAQTNIDIVTGLTATLGVRWTRDEKAITSSNYTDTNCLSQGIPLTTPVSAASTPSQYLGFRSDCSRNQTANFDAWSYTAGLNYRFNPNILVYGKFDRGYRAGGLQQSGGATTPAGADALFQPYLPEFVNDFEAGLKTDWFGNRLRINIDYFHSKLTNAQRTGNALLPSGATVVLITNAANATIQGAELSIDARPVRRLELSLRGAYIDAYFNDYSRPLGGGVFSDLSNLPVIFTPKWQISGSAAYTIDTGIGGWRNEVDVAYTDRQLMSEPQAADTTPRAFAPAHTIVNARSSLQIERYDLEVGVYVRNLTNRRYLVYAADAYGTAGFVLANPLNNPRTYGVSLLKRF